MDDQWEGLYYTSMDDQWEGLYYTSMDSIHTTN
jgi:hypothetical protein